MRILIVEDNRDIAANLYDYLESRGHAADHAADGVTGLHLAATNDYDAIVLDVALPALNGLELCRRLREDAKRDTPVLMLTARDTLDDKLAGFEHGADDYLVKPFALKEVEARLQALHKRRSGRVARNALTVGDLVFDPQTLSVTRGGAALKLPRKCLRLLEVMMANPNKVFSRAELEHAVWGESDLQSDTLRSHMHLLRRALAQSGRPDPIENVHGLGYRLVADHGR
ncbi:MAG: two-component system response regulator [Candidatus Muproteobacteria bacterium RBG_16_60_9]|uniref:Two-component system response regulator n=1 Tax=Candidatus Muproteobacteria bacterium RBG_16_60_9 TaxID=1817755 RepID=A0A1F6UZ85_9PROT|nr:MAG: two-component system response regulator [Candidatus Muproteobacteria bacterium RBG_16_60_9]